MDQLITLFVIVGIFVALLKDYVTPAVAFLSGLCVLVVSGIVPSTEAFSGLSNENLVTIAALFVIARMLENTIQVDRAANKLFGSSASERKGLARIMLPVGLASAFVNNTPVVAMLINPIISWSRKHNMASSKFLIPLSYAAIFGGALTLIGTSTNLVVSGLLVDYGYAGFSFFELTRYGLPLAVIGIGTIIALAPRLIPERDLADINASEIERAFTIDMSPSKALFEKTIAEAKLRKLKDVFLVEVIRANGDVITAVNPNTTIKTGDVLRFSGSADSLIALSKQRQLKPTEDKHVKQLDGSVYAEVVVGHNKSIVGQSLAEIGFRAKYQAAVIAIFRAGEKLEGAIGNVPLKPGDSLLVVSDEAFVDRWSDRNDFLFMRQISKTKSAKKKSTRLALGVISLVLALVLFGAPLPIATLAGAIACVLLGLITANQARTAIDFELLIMIAAAIGVAKGVELSGLANNLSSGIINVAGVLGGIGLLLGVIVATSFLTELITNAAAALLVFPVAMATAAQSSVDPRAFAIAIAIAASLSFVSPLGYQTNTMVYSAGGYKFQDFLRLGLVLNIITTITLTMLISIAFDLSF